MSLEYAHLPQSLAEVADVIGIAATLQLVEGWGGLRLYVPEAEHLSDEHPLVRWLGGERARQLCQVYAREKIDVARCTQAARAARDEAIYREHIEQGFSARSLAIQYGLTERQIWFILARHRDTEPDNLDLFED